MQSILTQIRADLAANAEEKNREGAKRYFKEQIKTYGVKTATVEKTATKYWLQVKTYGKQEIFALCEEMLHSDFMEEAFIVSDWLPRYIHYLEPEDLATFKRWIECYVNNWAKCDSFCNHTIGDLLQKYPQLVGEVKSWARSSNRWMKRASAVSLIVPGRRGLFLSDAFEICDTLLEDKDDLVQKGYGWLLKEESRLHQKQVFDYVMKNRKVMPRTALRYAIELMPKDLKTEAMKKQ